MHGQATWAWIIDILHGHEAWACCMGLENGQWTCSIGIRTDIKINIQHGHGHTVETWRWCWHWYEDWRRHRYQRWHHCWHGYHEYRHGHGHGQGLGPRWTRTLTWTWAIIGLAHYAAIMLGFIITERLAMFVSDLQYSTSKCTDLACKMNQLFCPVYSHQVPDRKTSRHFACQLGALRIGIWRIWKTARTSGSWYFFRFAIFNF